MDEKPSSSLKQVKEVDEKVTSEHTSSITNQAEDGSDLSAAKVAAMKAAELVLERARREGARGGVVVASRWSNGILLVAPQLQACCLPSDIFIGK